MAGRATQRIKIDTLVFEPGMVRQVSAVTAGTCRGLGFLVVDRIGFGVRRVAGRAIDGPAVMRAAYKHDLAIAHVFLSVTAEASMKLFIAGRCLLAPAKLGQRRETTATMRTRNVNAAGSVAGLAAMRGRRRSGGVDVTVGARSHRPHFLPGVTAQARLDTVTGIAGRSGLRSGNILGNRRGRPDAKKNQHRDNEQGGLHYSRF